MADAFQRRRHTMAYMPYRETSNSTFSVILRDMPNKTLTISSTYINALLRLAKMQGHEITELLKKVDILPSELQKQDISAVRFGQLYQAIINATKDEAFGMISAGSVPLGSLRLMCCASIHASDLEHAIRRCSDFYEILRGLLIRLFRPD